MRGREKTREKEGEREEWKRKSGDSGEGRRGRVAEGQESEGERVKGMRERNIKRKTDRRTDRQTEESLHYFLSLSSSLDAFPQTNRDYIISLANTLAYMDKMTQFQTAKQKYKIVSQKCLKAKNQT